jgi:branched-chain amino acid transport system ATP-binding protein
VTALELRGVTVRRGAGPVIRDIDLVVPRGEVTALVGPNGAGKTSLLEAISGAIPTASGSVSLDGVDLTGQRSAARFRRGLVHVEQGRAVFPGLTVLENLRLTARGADEVDRALEPFPELQKRRSSPAGLLSGGEQQMVVLARSLAADPRYLLLDEMSLGLAPVVFLRLLPFIGEIAARGVGVLLVEQFTHLALGVANSALVVAGGTATWAGPAAELLAEPHTLRRAYLGGGARAESA